MASQHSRARRLPRPRFAAESVRIRLRCSTAMMLSVLRWTFHTACGGFSHDQRDQCTGDHEIEWTIDIMGFERAHLNRLNARTIKIAMYDDGLARQPDHG